MDASDGANRLQWWLFAGIFGGLLGTALYCFQFQSHTGWTVLGASFLLAGAAIASGGALGFLFGIPKSMAGSGATQGASGTANGDDSYTPNTSLEQISDWLTKVIVGASLTQLGTIKRGAANLFHSVAPALGNVHSSAAYGGALIVYFALVGFVAGWLATRLYLTPALAGSDRRAAALYQKAAVAQQKGDTEAAGAFRAAASALLASTAAGAARYEQIRSQPAGDARTQQFDQIVNTARTTATTLGVAPDEIQSIFDQGGDGDRMMALGYIQGRPDPANFQIVNSTIAASRSGAEQYHGLVAAQELIPVLSAEQRRELRDTVTVQSAQPYIRNDPARAQLALAILKSLIGATPRMTEDSRDATPSTGPTAPIPGAQPPKQAPPPSTDQDER